MFSKKLWHYKTIVSVFKNLLTNLTSIKYLWVFWGMAKIFQHFKFKTFEEGKQICLTSKKPFCGGVAGALSPLSPGKSIKNKQQPFAGSRRFWLQVILASNLGGKYENLQNFEMFTFGAIILLFYKIEVSNALCY